MSGQRGPLRLRGPERLRRILDLTLRAGRIAPGPDMLGRNANQIHQSIANRQ
jgi:hypothetical protein